LWITENWLKDIPQQFQGKKNIEILIRAFARQLEEVYQILMDINGKTDIETAYGVNLDHVGTIVKLSRKEAYELDRGQLAGESFPDGRYRIYMRYKILRDTSDCTYFDIMEAIDLLWDVKKASYYEREDRPATIFIGLPNVDVDKEDPAKGKPTVIRPGGVGFLYTIQYWIVIDHRGLERMFLRRVTMRMKMPFWACNIFDGTWKFDGALPTDAKERFLGCNIFDGTWKFDNASLMDAKRRYDLRLIIECHGGNAAIEERILFPDIGIHGKTQISERFDTVKGYLHFGLRLDTSGDSMKSAARLKFLVKNQEAVGDSAIVIKRNPGFFDGSCKFDGMRIFNAIYREEVL